jgi:catechol 2,3-dioxygenase-like lactoylglutathione lyase family enzyme
MISALAHVCFRVRDLGVAEAFYRDKLGFAHAFDFVNENGERYGVYLHIAGRAFLELFTGAPEGEVPEGRYMHLCLEVPDLSAAVADLRAKSVEVTDPHFGSDYSWQSWLADPDGNRIEVHCYTQDSLQAPWLDAE